MSHHSGGQSADQSPAREWHGGVAWDEARCRAYSAGALLPPRRVPLTEASGLTLAEDIRARTPLPAFDTAAMDGFAVCGPGPWRLTGTAVDAGADPSPLRPGTATEIATGAKLPEGADAVVRIEDAAVHGESVTLRQGSAPRPGEHIRSAGEDAADGQILAATGAPVWPATIGLAAACGYDELLVRDRPQVTVLVTGDELIRRGLSGAGRVRDVLGPMAPSLVDALGGRVTEVRYVPDTPAEALIHELRAASVSRSTDVVVVTGATSAGRTDRLRDDLTALGVAWGVDGVACRPGHPQLLAVTPGGRPVIGLPGNPLAALVAAYTLIGSLIAGMTGRPLPGLARAFLGDEVRPARDGQVRLVPVRQDGAVVRTIGPGRSGYLGDAVGADGFAVVTPDWTPGREVRVLGCH